MGEKSHRGGWNLAWGRSVVGKKQRCDFCNEVAHSMQYVASERKWRCAQCADRPMLEKGKMFGKLRPISAKERDKQDNFVQHTKFDS